MLKKLFRTPPNEYIATLVTHIRDSNISISNTVVAECERSLESETDQSINIIIINAKANNKSEKNEETKLSQIGDTLYFSKMFPIYFNQIKLLCMCGLSLKLVHLNITLDFTWLHPASQEISFRIEKFICAPTQRKGNLEMLYFDKITLCIDLFLQHNIHSMHHWFANLPLVCQGPVYHWTTSTVIDLFWSGIKRSHLPHRKTTHLWLSCVNSFIMIVCENVLCFWQKIDWLIETVLFACKFQCTKTISNCD